jgi:IS1 family transposase
MAITIQEVRQKYPQYTDLSDKQLVDALHKKYYSDIPINDFYKQVGLKETIEEQPTPLSRKERAVDIGRSIATGAYKGIAGTAGLPGMLERGLEYLVTPTPKPEDVGKKQPITKYFEALRNLRSMASPLPSLTTQPITEKLFGGYMPTYEQITDTRSCCSQNRQRSCTSHSNRYNSWNNTIWLRTVRRTACCSNTTNTSNWWYNWIFNKS